MASLRRFAVRMALIMRIAVIGLGFMGLTHLKAYKRISGVEIGAVACNDPKVLAGDLSSIQGNLNIAGEAIDFSSAEKFSDALEAVRNARVDAVDICLPTAMHAEVAMEALAAGKHVLVEKPMALNSTECLRMLGAAKRAGRILMTAQVLRFFPAYQALLGAVEGGKLGTVRAATFRRRCAAPGWSAWLTKKELSGGGAFDLLIHDVDMALACFGVPATVAASGYEDTSRGLDLMTAQLHYQGGFTATVTGGWHGPGSYPFSMAYTVVGDNGTVEYDSAGSAPTLYSGGSGEHPFPLSPKDGYEAEIEYFVDCCRANAQPRKCPPEDSARAVALARLLDEARKRQGELIPCKI
jgi:predicted dehydrogenase